MSELRFCACSNGACGMSEVLQTMSLAGNKAEDNFVGQPFPEINSLSSMTN